MPNGESAFQKSLEGWEKESQRYRGLVEKGYQQVEEYQKQIESLQKPTGLGAKPLWSPLPESWAPKWMPPPGTQHRIAGIQTKAKAVSFEMVRNEFYSRLYNIIPAGILGNQIFTIEDALAVVRPPPDLPSDELDNVRDTIQEMINLKLPEPTEGVPELPPLELPKERPKIVGLQIITVEEIKKALQAPVVPEAILPTGEWNDLLNMAYPENADMTEVQKVEEEIKRIIEESKRVNAEMANFRAGIAEIPDFKWTEFAKELIIQPGLAILDVATVYFEKVSQPIAADRYKTFIPDIESLYQQYRMTGDSHWDALQKSWEEWDAPGGGTIEFMLKYMIMETVVDPLTWLAIFTAGTSMVAGMSGRFVKFATVLNKVNRVVWAPAEAPFNFVKWLTTGKWSADAVRALHLPEKFIGTYVIPKTVSQRAVIVEGLTGKVVKEYMEQMNPGKMMNKGMTMKDWDKAVKSAIRQYFKNPNGTGNVTETGMVLLKHEPFDQDDIVRMADRLGLTLTKDDITRNMVGDINGVFEAMFQKYGAKTGRLLTPSEAGRRVLQVLGLSGSDAKVDKIAVRILEERANKIINSALSFSQLESPGKALQQLMRRNFKTHIAIEESIAFLAMKQNSRFIPLLGGVEARFIAIWQNYIEKMVVRPLAESYLTFAMYGPMNVVEDYWRSILGGVFPRRMTADRMGLISQGLSIDYAMIDPKIGISESLGRMRRSGSEDQWNNWILQLAMVGQKNWADKLYTGLVRLPAGFGMDIRRNFVGQKYLVLFKEMGGEKVELILKATGRLPALKDKRLIKELTQAVYDAKTTGKVENIIAVKDMFTRKSIYRREVNNILKEHPDLPNNVRDYLIKSYDDNTLFINGPVSINTRMKEANLILMDQYLKSGEYIAKQFKELIDMLTGLKVTNPEEMAHLLVNLNITQQIYGQVPEELLAQATIRSQGLPLAERRLRFDKTFDDIINFRDGAGGDIERAVNKVRLSLGTSTVMPDSWDKLAAYIDKLPVEQHGAFADVITFLDGYSQLAIKGKGYSDDAVNILFDMVRKDSPTLPTVLEAVDLPTRVNKVIAIDNYVQIAHSNIGAWLKRSIPVPNDVSVVIDSMVSVYVGDVLNDLAKGKVKTVGLVSQEYVDKTTRLLDLIIAKKQLSDKFRLEDMAWRRETFAGVSQKEMGDEWWQSFYREARQRIHGNRVKMVGIEGDIISASKEVNLAGGIEQFTRRAIRVTDRPLAPMDVANLIGSQGDDLSRAILDNLIIINDRDMFVEYVIRQVRPGDEGFTRGAIGQVYDQIAYSLRVSPDAMSWLTSKQLEMKAVRQDLHYLYHSKLLPDDEVAEIGRYVGETADAVGKVIYKPGTTKLKEGFTDLQQIRQKAMDEANKWYYKEFTDYTHGNVVDAMMKAVFPFWTYESQRWFWMPRSFIRYPGTFTAFERWQDNTDYGYIPIPGMSVEVNPVRGTVYGPLTTRLTRRDYPEYYDAWSGTENITGFFDWISRYGFYPGGHFTVPLALFGGAEAQTGEAMPPAWRTPLMALQAIFPKSDFVNTIVDKIFPDRFRNYMNIVEVTANGYDGTLINTKLKNKIPLTEEEQAAWDSAKRPTAIYSLLFEQSGMLRLRKPEQKAVYEAVGKYIEEKYDITIDQQRQYRMHGINIWDTIGGMSLDDIQILEELEYFRYQGLSRPLLPGKQQEVLDRIELDWDEIDRFVESLNSEEAQLEIEFRSARLSGSGFNDGLVGLYERKRKFIDHKMEENPNLTLEGRKKYFEDNQIPMPVLGLLKELMNLYTSIELREVRNPETGELEEDWDTFWVQRYLVGEAVPDEYKQEWEGYLSRNLSQLEMTRGEVYRTYFSKYNYVWQKVLESYSEPEQKLIEEYLYLERMDIDFDRQEEIRNIVSKDGRKLVSAFRSDVAEARRAMRFANPHLDAWLRYWGRTASFLTPQAKIAYRQIAKDTGRVV